MQLIARIAIFYLVYKVVRKLVDKVFLAQSPHEKSRYNKDKDIIDAEYREID